ncbi:ArnT family glycosyltransferase [Hymenobacter cellulosivorans]|uniref:Glycosyltransferase family 39 protein n=1 Tax=Hymenobacter cellulosivorans TaxID=2932249 RepID=A0ABY4F556_9BACT|nr:glycosyltransferase family 39 protein [Hymenobacter cellulosivorans]UOQ51331.1 glycosyltransferase family 39 protein [Hymenobacter cellulosivorans]
MKPLYSSRLPDLTLAFVLLLTVAYFLLTHEGLYDLDDYFYARYAHQLASGTFRVEPDPLGLLHDPLKERWLIFGPVALLYRVFGIGIITTTLWPLLATLGCSLVIWATYRRHEPVVAAGAMLLLGLHYFTLNLTNYLYPDNILMFWCLCCGVALLKGRQAARRPWRWGAGFALLNFAALLSKETIVYYLPCYLALLAVDVFRRRHARFWLAAAGVGVVMLGAYLAFYQAYTNDALYRIHLIEHTNEYLKEGNFLGGNRGALLARLTYLPLVFFVGTGLAGALVLAGAAGLQRRLWLSPDARFWLLLTFTTLAFYWLGSTSLSQYNPITLLPRMSTPLLPPLCLAAGFGLRSFLDSGRGGYWLTLLLLAAAAWLHNSVSVIYGLLALYFAGATWWAARATESSWRPGTGRFARLALGTLALALSIRPVYFMGKPRVSAHFAQQRVISQQLAAPARGVVFVDNFLVGNYDFYYGFQVPAGLRFRRYTAADSVQVGPGEQAWLLVNSRTLTNPELTRKLIRSSEAEVLARFPRRRLLTQDQQVRLYRVELPPAD